MTINKEIKLTEAQYEEYLFLNQVEGLSWYESIGQILNIPCDGNFVIKSSGTSSNPESSLIVVFLEDW